MDYWFFLFPFSRPDSVFYSFFLFSASLEQSETLRRNHIRICTWWDSDLKKINISMPIFENVHGRGFYPFVAGWLIDWYKLDNACNLWSISIFLVDNGLVRNGCIVNCVDECRRGYSTSHSWRLSAWSPSTKTRLRRSMRTASRTST
jgi:hypothetical protein